MYTNFIYFIIVLLVFSTQQPSLAPRLSLTVTLGASLGLVLLFALINRWLFRQLARRIAAGHANVNFAVLYHRTVSRQSLLALLFFCAQVYLLDVKFHLIAFAAIRASFTLQGLAALGLFLLHLAIVWYYSYECQCLLSGCSDSRSSMVIANINFNLAILLPWLLISGSFDLLQLLPVGTIHDYLNTPLGQVLFFAVLLVIFMVFAPPLVMRLWGCRPLPPGDKRTFIEKFCREQSFSTREILLWPGFGAGSLTAGVMGLHRRCRYLLVTEGLLNILDEDELRAVLAHELGHVKEKHLFFYLLFLLGYLVLAYPLSVLSFLLVLASDLPVTLTNRTDAQFLTVISTLSTLPLLLLLIFYFRFLFGFFIRNFERQADLHVFRVMPKPSPLISALEKVALYSGNIRDVPSWHHFSIKQRVDYLTAAASEPSLLRFHRRKLNTALAVYMVGLVLVGTVGYLFHVDAIGASFNRHLNIRVLSSMARLEPQNPQLLLRLGTLQYSLNNLKEAVFHLERALSLDPDNPDIMNNLAWILATSRDDPFSQPQRALALAEKAAHASPEAYILDTLAEAYSANGLNHKAVAAAEQALAVASGNRSYYLEQVNKFRRMAENLDSSL
ncbi:MAG: M48 family metalloprotease [Deltaproteobacteria bacterium]|nr:MAG: M48 family metalloprotease [Deltaproteobacteria bacterium]